MHNIIYIYISSSHILASDISPCAFKLTLRPFHVFLYTRYISIQRLLIHADGIINRTQCRFPNSEALLPIYTHMNQETVFRSVFRDTTGTAPSSEKLLNLSVWRILYMLQTLTPPPPWVLAPPFPGTIATLLTTLCWIQISSQSSGRNYSLRTQ